ncbi:hypothetical protein BRPE64_CCDS00700 [Caballeronia insecticola]|uniref:Uncharacterized protein n=1 Tax=Caballeronia insecticola TaxID=758793 RepID=R4WND9_9BURK|nr:hypothetical protein BRPE64_CCDS00700 [Caballeronia insecticola]
MGRGERGLGGTGLVVLAHEMSPDEKRNVWFRNMCRESIVG